VSSEIDLIRISESLAPLESDVELDWKGCLFDRHPLAITSIGGIPAIISEPAMILWEGDTIALWYLSGALARPIQVSSVHNYHNEIYCYVKICTNQTWRTSSNYFTNGGIPSGCLEFSPARHLQGHETWKHQPTVSANLATVTRKQWIENICLPSALLSGALSIIHPSLYQVGLQTME
ncbi:hypothetical protein V8B97DRAFT_1855332, partial [Scleroderma yunnanense]